MPSAGKAYFPVFFMLLNAFLWYYLSLDMISTLSKNFGTEYLPSLLSLHSAGVIAAGFLGLFFSKKRYKLLFLWTILGAATSLPILMPIYELSLFQLICFAWGFSLGLGMPACLSYFTEKILVEKRGRFGGLVFSASFLFAILVTGLGQLFGSFFTPLFFVAWRFLGLIPFLTLELETKDTELETAGKQDVVSVVHDRRLYLYLIPWFTFNIVNTLEDLLLRGHVEAAFPEQYTLLKLMSLLFHMTFAFVGGLACDLVGRKPIAISGFCGLGIAYALISIIPSSLAAWFFFFIGDGLAWGMFYTIFVTVIWGDLAPKGMGQYYYYLGNIPLFLATIVQMCLARSITFLSATSAFSLAAFFLFLAVLPILFAPETLPEKKILERQVKDYVEKARKLKDKYVQEPLSSS